ncbi:MAG: ribulose-phosphate 3-epimerase [bacterium]
MLLAGSIIGGNLLNIDEILKLSQEANVDWLHIDVMDGNFVPNLTMGIDFLKKIKSKTFLPIDVHLMVQNPEKYLEYSLYCDMINFHIETTFFPFRMIEQFKNKNPNIRVGLAFNPITSVDVLKFLEGYIDNVLIMTVEPGFSGQKFIYNMLPKIEEVNKIIKNWKNEIFISVDGGINEQTLELVLAKGANFIICASFLYQDYSKIKENVIKIKNNKMKK